MRKDKENHNNTKNSGTRGRNPLVITVFISIVIMLIATAVSFYFYVYTENSLEKNMALNSSGEYSQYYALICENNEFNRQVYEYARKKGESSGICVDMLSQRISHDYSVAELFEIAMESKVDGIIVEANDTQNMRNLIDKACSQGIDVVTFLSDCPDSMRRSSVQVGAYNVGKIYGQQVVSKPLGKGEKIVVINDSSKPDAMQTLIFSGIQDTVYSSIGSDTTIQITPYSVDGSDAFSMEEMIRAMLTEGEAPSIIICPDNQATEIMYQALVDYNMVGLVRLIGYHDSKTVLEGIRQGVIEATIVIDVEEIGEMSVEALAEYKAFGFVSEYYGVDSTLIDKNNILKYYPNENN